MTIVTGYTAEHMDVIKNGTIVSAYVDPTTKHLILVRFDNSLVDAGYVQGPMGNPGTGNIICTSTTRPLVTSGDAGLTIYETNTKRERLWNGTQWVARPKGFLQKAVKGANNNAPTSGWARAIGIDNFVLLDQSNIQINAWLQTEQLNVDATGLTQAQLSIEGGEFTRFLTVYNYGENQDRADHATLDVTLPAGTYTALVDFMGSSTGTQQAKVGSWISITDNGAPPVTP